MESRVTSLALTAPPLPGRHLGGGVPDAFDDPALLGFPPAMPLEIALRTAPIESICEAYDIDEPTWEALRQNPAFREQVKLAREMLKAEGMSFKMKARLQAEELLKTSWALIHGDAAIVPAHVKANLIIFTVKAAGLDASKDQGAAAADAARPMLNINIVM